MVMSCHQHLGTDQVSSLSGKYNQKQHFIRARQEGRFYKDLVCIVLMIGSVVDIMKESLTLNYFLAFAKTKSSKNAQNHEKTTKVWTLISHNQTFDVYHKYSI